MRCYLEVWLRDLAKDYLRSVSRNNENYHPHITLVRPFEVKNNAQTLKDFIVDFCVDHHPIPYILEGKGTFDGKVNYVPVIGSKLLQFSIDLESMVARHVELAPQLGDFKTLHATFHTDGNVSCPRIEEYMLRLTAIADKKIWFSYDFVSHEALDRQESLDKIRWQQTLMSFSSRYGFPSSHLKPQPI